jgi:transcriptional regulator with XRE-family HTH domain
LVTALTEARLGAGLTGAQLGAVHDWGSGRVSKIESGRTRPSVDDVRAWLATTSPDLDGDARRALVELSEQISSVATSWSDIDREGIAAQQEDRASLEAEAELIQIYQSKVIPGLGQTGEYTREMLLALGRDPEEVPAAVLARAERQRVLYNPQVTIEMVIQESVLRRRFGSPAVQLAQLSFLRGLARLPTVYLGIVTDEVDEELLPETSFVIKKGADYAEVQVELLTRELTMPDANDLAKYSESFGRQKAAAVEGDKADAVLQRASDYVATLIS